MKRSLLIGSFLCVLLGVIAVICSIIKTPIFITTAVLLSLYLVGIPFLFVKLLPKKEVSMLSKGLLYLEYGKRFWLLISLGVLASVFVTVLAYKARFIPLSSSFLFAMGVAAIFTAFVSPTIKIEEEADEF